jgi:hypothetical protein
MLVADHTHSAPSAASAGIDKGTVPMRKALPDTMFNDPERSRLTMLRGWVLDNEVTEIEMNERQFWNFAHLQPVAEKPWAAFTGRLITCPSSRRNASAYWISEVLAPDNIAGRYDFTQNMEIALFIRA